MSQVATQEKTTLTQCRSQKSIAIYFDHLTIGGADIVLLRLATAFAEAGLHVWFIVRDSSGRLQAALPSSVTAVTIDQPSTLRALAPLCRFVAKNRPDILMSAYPLNNLAVVLAARLGFPQTSAVLTEHAPLDAAYSAYHRLHRLILPRLLPRLYGRADAVVAVSAGVRDSLTAAGVPADRLHVLRNPVIAPDFVRSAAGPVDHPWFADPTRPVVLGVGRLAEDKDFPTLIRAFAKVPERLRARLVIVGEGKLHAELAALVGELGLDDDVWLAGYRADPAALMSRSSVLVSSSSVEGFGLVMVEALACGCPVVATATDGAVDALDGGRLGRLVPVGDADAMATAIAATLDHPPAPQPGRAWAARFTLEASAEAYLALFSQLGCGR